MALADLLCGPNPDIQKISKYLEGLASSARIAETQALSGRAQAALFDAASGFRPIGLDDLVPADFAPLAEVPHHGRNSLPAFRLFAKVFCRPDGGATNELWGYNRNPRAFVETVVGPGYYVAYPYTTPGEVLVDYLRTPPRKPAAWPPILANSERLSRFVYNGTQDVLRGVSRHVSIGRASRHGKVMDNWFVLCRA
jgi:hypothetical protein